MYQQKVRHPIKEPSVIGAKLKLRSFMRLNDFSIGDFIGPIIIGVQPATEQPDFFSFYSQQIIKDFSANCQRRIFSLMR